MESFKRWRWFVLGLVVLCPVALFLWRQILGLLFVLALSENEIDEIHISQSVAGNVAAFRYFSMFRGSWVSLWGRDIRKRKRYSQIAQWGKKSYFTDAHWSHDGQALVATTDQGQIGYDFSTKRQGKPQDLLREHGGVGTQIIEAGHFVPGTVRGLARREKFLEDR